MKSTKLIVSFTFALILVPYFHPAQSQIRPPRVAADQLQQESGQQQKNEYQKYVEKKLAEFDDRLRALRAEAEKAGEKAKLKFEETSKEFDRKMTAARQNLERIKADGQKTWDEMKDKMNALMRDLEKSYERLAQRWNKPSDHKS